MPPQRDDTDPRARLSVLDRLVDRNAAQEREGRPRRTASAEQLKALVRRDLEWLLSTRRTPQRADPPADLGRTVTEFGLPDFAPVSPDDEPALGRIAFEVRAAIEAFEPRLRDVTVRIEPSVAPGRVGATVEALLVAGNVRTPVTFPFKIRTSG